MDRTFTDLHTHILPGIDDGAQDLETALELLRAEKKNGVERVALTPHFYPLRETVAAFMERRQLAFEKLTAALDPVTMPSVKLGAEVSYTPLLLQVDLRQLTIGGGRYLLLELSDYQVPSCAEQVIEAILEQDIVPILAHVERCAYFREDPHRLRSLIKGGALAQVSAEALGERDDRNFAKSCLDSGLAQVIASDTHCTPVIQLCAYMRKDKRTKQLLLDSEEVANAIWHDAPVPSVSVASIKRGLFKYYC